MGQTDAQFKDSLRKDLKTFERIKELLTSNKPEAALKEIEDEIKRINSSLQD